MERRGKRGNERRERREEGEGRKGTCPTSTKIVPAFLYD